MAGKVFARRFWWRWGGLAALLATLLPAASGSEHPLAREVRLARSHPDVRIFAGNWGAVDVRDIEVFLQAVAEEVLSYVADPQAGALKIRVVPRSGLPRVLYDRGRDGEYVVHLTARNENWFQYAYQFSHELCHIASHFDRKDRNGEQVASVNQWFEEALCETASLFTLKRLAAVWADDPPARQWIGYAKVLADYADFLQRQAHRQLPPTQTLDQWYRENQAVLAQSPYERERNELVATALLPLFEKDPRRWRAIAYLNPDTASAAKGFADFLGDWHAACPADQKDVVREIMSLFGFKPAIGSLAESPAASG